MKKSSSFFRVWRALGLVLPCALLSGCYSLSYNAPIASVTGQPISDEPAPKPTTPTTPPAAPAPANPQPVNPAPAPAQPVSPAPATPTQPAVPSTPSVSAPSNTPKVSRAKDARLATWKWPTQGEIIQRFNERQCQNSPNQIGGGCGIDIAGQEGQPIYAATSGRVNYAGNGIPGLGNLIIISNNKGYIVAYAHLQKIQVKVNDYVQAGQRIGTMGKSDADSPRLHMEVRRNGDPCDPLTYLPQP